MSSKRAAKARLVITAITLENRTVADVVDTYGVSKSWVYELLARHRAEGDTALEPRSKRPHTSPNATPPEVVELILLIRKDLLDTGLDAGAETIGWHLNHRHGRSASKATIHRILTRSGLVTPNPSKRPKSSYIRFEAAMPNETWQSDFTHYRLTHPDGRTGKDVEIITWLDDHSRYALHVTAHARVTAPIVLTTFRHDRIRHDVVSTTGNVTLRIAGQLRHIGVGRTHARTRVILLVQDLHVRIVHAATGELLRELIIDPTKDYQPLNSPK